MTWKLALVVLAAVALLASTPASARFYTATTTSSTAGTAIIRNLEQQFVCKVCGKPGADVRPDFNSLIATPR